MLCPVNCAPIDYLKTPWPRSFNKRINYFIQQLLYEILLSQLRFFLIKETVNGDAVGVDLSNHIFVFINHIDFLAHRRQIGWGQ